MTSPPAPPCAAATADPEVLIAPEKFTEPPEDAKSDPPDAPAPAPEVLIAPATAIEDVTLGASSVRAKLPPIVLKKAIGAEPSSVKVTGAVSVTAPT